MLKLWVWQQKRPPQGIEALRTLPNPEGDRGPLGLSPTAFKATILEGSQSRQEANVNVLDMGEWPPTAERMRVALYPSRLSASSFIR